MKSISLRTLMAAAVVAVSLVSWTAARAQDLSGFRLGDTPTKLSNLGQVAGIEKYKGMDVYRWVFPNGNPFMATVDAEGEIVYLESDWGGKSEETGCDLPGMKFGVTTLADLEKRFGSDGFGFRRRLHLRPAGDGFMLLNSWEAGNQVVTFYTLITAKDYEQVKASGSEAAAAGNAKLVGISITNAAYAKVEWGARMVNPAYKKIEWK